MNSKAKNYKPFFLVGIAIVIITIIVLFSQSTEDTFTNTETSERYQIIDPKIDNNQNLKILPQKNINKTPQEFFGFTVDSSNSAIKATNSEQKFSIRFTSKFSYDATSVLLPMKINPGDTVKVSLQESIGGLPSGISLASATTHPYEIIIPTTDVMEANFTNSVPLERGKIYHLVVEPEFAETDQSLRMRTYQEKWSVNSLNHTNPDEVWKDSSIEVLFFDGTSWNETEKWPIYVLRFANGITDGQPYTLFAPWIIGEDRYVGQAVIPYSDYEVNQLSFVVAQKGVPSDDLYYAIYDSETHLLREGLFAKEGDLKKLPEWLDVSFSPSLTFEAGNLYRVVLYSPNSTLKDGYHIYGHEFMLDKTLGYGSTIHHLTASFNGLQSWIEWYDADATFKFVFSN